MGWLLLKFIFVDICGVNGLMIETFGDMKNIPVTSMTVGDILKYFEAITSRSYNGDEDVYRSISEVASRFMAEAMYKYYNHKDADGETSNAPAREECESWKEKWLALRKKCHVHKSKKDYTRKEKHKKHYE